MKKFLIVLVCLLLLSTGLFAEINIGNFPPGKWLDSNYDALWVFALGSIKIQDVNTGELYYDFGDKTIENLEVKATTEGVVLSFYCRETEKKYSFVKPMSNKDIILRIERTGKDLYEVTMPNKN